jgi:hypothetical protein
MRERERASGGRRREKQKVAACVSVVVVVRYFPTRALNVSVFIRFMSSLSLCAEHIVVIAIAVRRVTPPPPLNPDNPPTFCGRLTV